MANTSKAQVIADVAASDYADLFEQVWGPGSMSDVEVAYDQVALSIAAFERTELFGQLSSQYDAYLEACKLAGGGKDDCAKGIGKVARKVGKKYFSKEESYGFQLFMNENNNLEGAPVDLGLGPIVDDPAENGKIKVMTLRNIGLTAPYAHNGLFKNLKEITHFCNTRDVPGSLPKDMYWAPPEYPDTVYFDELGSMGFSDADEDALVEFMKTLSDGYSP
jgi:cytochrome c peroxidase